MLKGTVSNQPNSFHSPSSVIPTHIDNNDINPNAMEHIVTAELNYNVASKFMSSSNFPEAHFYVKAAAKSLPGDHWRTHYELSRQIFWLLSNVAHACGFVNEAIAALEVLLIGCESMDDKIDAYSLVVTLLLSRHQSVKAYRTCINALEEMGESIPETMHREAILQMREVMKTKYGHFCEKDFLSLKDATDEKAINTMMFYSQMCSAARSVKPMMQYFIGCRLMELRYVCVWISDVLD